MLDYLGWVSMNTTEIERLPDEDDLEDLLDMIGPVPATVDEADLQIPVEDEGDLL